MKLVYFLLSAAITVGLVIILNTKIVAPAALGTLLAPQQGLWQNAEPTNADFNEDLKFENLKGKTNVYFDERLVPHIFAEQEVDAYFVQGYLHAKFRLFQMELQTYSAAGRASEVVGDVALNHDREFLRLGMVYAAEIALKEIEKSPIKPACDAYTAGVNAYIATLTESTLPIEYKLLNLKPERWSNLKSALFLKYMAYDLSSHEDDFEMTNAKAYFSPEDFNLLYPSLQDSLDPIIPKGTIFEKPAFTPTAPANADSAYFKNKVATTAQVMYNANRNNGSNNWAVAGSKTKSGAPILCNDPHLGLNLPSIWYEMQISTPAYNAYGATFPGSPFVIIGYNDSCAFGFTNGGRDVRDYYEIQFKDKSRSEYRYNNTWKKTTFRVEEIKIKDKPSFYDTVAYTVFGPVMYDASFNGGKQTNQKNYAVRWKAHDPSNDVLVFSMLNRTKNYADYNAAVQNLASPGQNCVFAAKNGDIALRTQGEWPAKWKGQGDFIMPGVDSAYNWQGIIPQNEMPYQFNPTRGFVSSANQKPVDDANYPYYIGRNYPQARGVVVNKKLEAMSQITPQDMMLMQTNNDNIDAANLLPLFLKNLDNSSFEGKQLKYYNLLKNWNYKNEAKSEAATVYEIFYKKLRQNIYSDEFASAPKPINLPFESTFMEAILKDTAYKFIDDITTPKKENFKDILLTTFKLITKDLMEAETNGKLKWADYKNTSASHLLKIAPFSKANINVGGGVGIINATTYDHGPSWRMIVSLTKNTEAYGIYPGGQNGNPGSKYYDNFIAEWAVGKYYLLWMMTTKETNDVRIKWKMNFVN